MTKKIGYMTSLPGLAALVMLLGSVSLVFGADQMMNQGMAKEEMKASGGMGKDAEMMKDAAGMMKGDNMMKQDAGTMKEGDGMQKDGMMEKEGVMPQDKKV